MLEFLSVHTPHSKLLGTTSGIIILAVVVSILLILLIGSVFLAAARPDYRHPGQPRSPRAAARRHRAIEPSEGQGHWPAEHPGDRHVREGGHHAGRPASWVVIGVVVLAFIVGGLALIAHAWWLFWACVAVVVLGAPAGKAVGIMNDTVEWGSSEAALTSGSGSGEVTGPDEGIVPDERRGPDRRPAGLPGETEHRP